MLTTFVLFIANHRSKTHTWHTFCRFFIMFCYSFDNKISISLINHCWNLFCCLTRAEAINVTLMYGYFYFCYRPQWNHAINNRLWWRPNGIDLPQNSYSFDIIRLAISDSSTVNIQICLIDNKYENRLWNWITAEFASILLIHAVYSCSWLF